MLEKERFLAIKKLARDIRKDNDKLFQKFEKENPDEAIKEKEKFIADLIDNMESAFSDGEQGREEKQIFRANVLVPDDDEFYKSYSENKNIRNLMKKYAVNIEDVMSKITELNIYAKYINDIPAEETNFVDEMVNLETKEKENLLDEIDALSNTLTNLELEPEKPKKNSFINQNIKTEEPEETIDEDNSEEEEIEELEQEKLEEISVEESTEPKEMEDDILSESFDNINDVVSNFVNDYNSAKEEIQSLKEENEKLNNKIESLEEENNTLAQENKKLSSKEDEFNRSTSKLNKEIESLKAENDKLKDENKKANDRMKVLEEKLMKSAAILKRLYNGINKK